jgi:hypothetical protein
LWHTDDAAGDQLPAFHPDRVGCHRDSVTVLLSAESTFPETSLYFLEGSESIERDAVAVMPSAGAGCTRAGLPRKYCSSLRRTVDSGHRWSCLRKNVHQTDLPQDCELRVDDLLGRQTEELLAFTRRFDPSAGVQKLELRELEFFASRSPMLHSSAHLGNQTRVALEFQYVPRGCPVRLPVTHAGPRPMDFDTSHPNRLAITLDSGGTHKGGAAEDPSVEVMAMEPAALAKLDLANLDIATSLNVPAVYSPTDSLRQPSAPWQRNVLVLDGAATGTQTPADHTRNLWGAVHIGVGLAPAQSCHLTGFDITTVVSAWGVPPEPLHVHDDDVHELCWQQNGTAQYEFEPLDGDGRQAVWEGNAGTVTYFPGLEAHRYRCAGDGARLAGDNATVEFVRRPCMLTCFKLIPRKAPAPECQPVLAGLEPIRVGGAALQTGVVGDALGWLDRNIKQRRARPGADPLRHLHTPLFRGTNPDGSRLHVFVGDYPVRTRLHARAGSYDVFFAVVRGACSIGYHEREGETWRAMDRDLVTGSIVLKPAGANLTITTRPRQTVRLLVVEVAAAEKR